MDLDEFSVKATSVLRHAGLSDVPKPALAGVILVGLLLVILGVWQFWPRSSESFAVIATQQSTESASVQSRDTANDLCPIVVDIEGAVKNPGLYSLEADSRIGKAVEAAGGFTENAALGAVNLAQKLADGEQVRIPSKDDIETGASSVAAMAMDASPSSTGNGKVNINTASAEELQKLSGIGPSLSERIIDYRTANGGFSSIEDLLKVSGIGETRFANLKDKICV